MRLLAKESTDRGFYVSGHAPSGYCQEEWRKEASSGFKSWRIPLLVWLFTVPIKFPIPLYKLFIADETLFNPDLRSLPNLRNCCQNPALYRKNITQAWTTFFWKLFQEVMDLDHSSLVRRERMGLVILKGSRPKNRAF